jgi:hypothetical protein
MDYNDRIPLSTSRTEPWSTFFQQPGLRTDHELKIGFAISAEKVAESDDDDAILAAKLAAKGFRAQLDRRMLRQVSGFPPRRPPHRTVRFGAIEARCWRNHLDRSGGTHD